MCVCVCVCVCVCAVWCRSLSSLYSFFFQMHSLVKRSTAISPALASTVWTTLVQLTLPVYGEHILFGKRLPCTHNVLMCFFYFSAYPWRIEFVYRTLVINMRAGKSLCLKPVSQLTQGRIWRASRCASTTENSKDFWFFGDQRNALETQEAIRKIRTCSVLASAFSDARCNTHKTCILRQLWNGL